MFNPKVRINRADWNVFASAASFESNLDLNFGISDRKFTHEPKKNDNDLAVNSVYYYFPISFWNDVTYMVHNTIVSLL